MTISSRKKEGSNFWHITFVFIQNKALSIQHENNTFWSEQSRQKFPRNRAKPKRRIPISQSDFHTVFLMRAHNGRFLHKHPRSQCRSITNSSSQVAVEHNLVKKFNTYKMKCLLLLGLFVFAHCEVKEEKDVLVVTTDNFIPVEVVNDGTTVLVEFCK